MSHVLGELWVAGWSITGQTRGPFLAVIWNHDLLGEGVAKEQDSRQISIVRDRKIGIKVGKHVM